jgi:lipid-A-disaccharide synthase
MNFYEDLTGQPNTTVIYGKTLEILRMATAALVTSGTATLETALIGTPQVVCYKTAPLSFAIARLLIRVKHISLVNLILERTCVEELIQNKCTAINLIASLNKILHDPDYRRQITDGYLEMNIRLGELEASGTAAAIVCRMARET